MFFIGTFASPVAADGPLSFRVAYETLCAQDGDFPWRGFEGAHVKLLRSWLKRLSHRRARGLAGSGTGTSADADVRSPSRAIAQAIRHQERLVHELQEALDAQVRALDQLTLHVRADGDRDRLPRQPDEIGAIGQPVGAEVTMVARLLGSFEIEVAGTMVETWRSQRAASLLKYLLLQERRSARRETLMDVFWPSSSPKAARNNLNVTVYQLRSTLRSYDETRTYIVYRAGSYRIDPEVAVWTDVEEYTQAVRTGHRCEDAGDTFGALAAYRHARTLYRGELVEDELVGEWFLDLQRRLRLDYHAVLERLGVLLLEHGDVGQSVVVGEELLASDPCRETGHQLLMRK
jgi:DNA-binding SARP family transcriptional activator